MVVVVPEGMCMAAWLCKSHLVNTTTKRNSRACKTYRLTHRYMHFDKADQTLGRVSRGRYILTHIAIGVSQDFGQQTLHFESS